jgi:acyl carrier protein
LKAVYEARRPRPLFAQVGTGATVVARADGGPQRPALLERLEQADPDDWRDILLQFVSDEAARILGAARGTRLDPDTGLFEMGMDSLMSVELKTRLERGIGRALPSTLTFNYPNISALAGYLEGQVLEPSPTAGPQVLAPVPDADEDLSDDLSEDDLAAMLAARLEGIK